MTLGHIYFEKIGAGKPTFVLHGGPGLDSSYFRPYLDSLSSHSSLYFIDSRGCGKSKRLKTEDYHVDGILKDIEALRIHEGHKQIAILGHSFGGFLALEYALKYPERVSRLALISTCSDSSWIQKCSENCKKYPDVVSAEKSFDEGEKTDADFKRYIIDIARLYFKDPEKCKAKEVFDRITYNTECYLKIASDYFGTYTVTENLREITVPSLVLAGGHDEVIPPENSESLAKLLPKGQFRLLGNSGHFPFIEEQEEFIRIYANWWIKE